MPHPRTPFARSIPRPRGTATALGYRMPAEWEPMARVWLTPPYNPETWPGCLGKAQAQFRRFMAELRKSVTIVTTQSIKAPTNDSWIRDYGPIFVVQNRQGENKKSRVQSPESRVGKKTKALPAKAAHDFRFNGWGGKYEVRDKDDVVPQHIARRVGVPLWIHDLVLEGGSIDVNGVGSVMTTAQCLLNKNRNPRLSRSQIINELHRALGTRHAIWLPGGIIGDDTDGHIDDIARFVNPTTVVGIRAPKGHQDYEMLNRNWKALQTARDQDGKKLTVIPLPVPDPILYDFPPDRFGPGGVNPVPASYANFLIANGSVLVPIFGQKTDDTALRTLAEAMPKHRVVGIRAEHLVVGLGSFHCLSQQEPV
ncbi:MAG: agmatine deiminase family protein [Planctomycetes bacterium]|nr:agmatine deiminase family protein [Planctomycetota bacterium]